MYVSVYDDNPPFSQNGYTEIPQITKSVQRCISKSLFNKTMYKNIGTDTAGVALCKLESVGKNIPSVSYVNKLIFVSESITDISKIL